MTGGIDLGAMAAGNVSYGGLIALGVAFMTLLTFIAYGFDKWKARHKRWRTPEATLLWLAVLGGSVGALLGMRVWHHKTQHKKFTVGVPLILLAQVALVVYALYCGAFH